MSGFHWPRDVRERFTRTVRESRKNLHMTAQGYADFFGVGVDSVVKWERGERLGLESLLWAWFRGSRESAREAGRIIKETLR